MSPMIECTRCHTQNPDSNKYCGVCGAPLDAELGPLVQYVDIAIRQQVESIVKEQLRDPNSVEIEATQRVVERLIGWARMAVFIGGIPVMIMIGILAFLGIDSLSDLSGKVDTAEKNIEEATLRIQVKMNEETERLDAQLEKAEAEIDSITERSRILLADIDTRFGEVAKVTEVRDLEIKVNETKTQAKIAGAQAQVLQTDLAKVDTLSQGLQSTITATQKQAEDAVTQAQELRTELEKVETLAVAVVALGDTVNKIEESVCFTAFFDDVQPERWSPVEVDTRDFDIIEPPQAIKGIIGIKFTDFGQPIGAIKIFPNPDNENFRVVTVVDATCQEVEEFKNISREGPKDALENFDTLEMRIGSGTYQLSLGMGEDIEADFIKLGE